MTTFNNNPNTHAHFSQTLGQSIAGIRKNIVNPIIFRFHHVCAQTKSVDPFLHACVEKCDNYDYKSDEHDMHEEIENLIALLSGNYANGKNKKQFRKFSLPLRRFIKKYTKNKCYVSHLQSRIQMKMEDGTTGWTEHLGIPVIDVFITAQPCEESRQSDADAEYIHWLLGAGCRAYYRHQAGATDTIVAGFDKAPAGKDASQFH